MTKEELISRGFECVTPSKSTQINYLSKIITKHDYGGQVYLFAHFKDNELIKTGLVFGEYEFSEEIPLTKKLSLEEFKQLEYILGDHEKDERS